MSTLTRTAAIDAAGVEEIWCLGDTLGYGADPDGCTDVVRERCAIVLVGNHDLAVLGALDIAAFSEAAAEAVAWTRENVAERTLAHLRELEPAGEREGVGLFHASPRDPIWEYVLSAEQADACFDAQTTKIALIGHSHVSLYFNRPTPEEADDDVRGAQSDDGVELWLNGRKIHSNDVARSLGAEPDQIKGTLRKGTNALLLKVANGLADWAFRVELETRQPVRER